MNQPISVYYFKFKLIGNHRDAIGRLSETELRCLFQSGVEHIATPDIFPPGSIMWHAGELTPEEIARCQWLAFVAEVYKLTWKEKRDWAVGPFKALIEELKTDYDAFLTFLESADLQPIFTQDVDWAKRIAPQAFKYQSPARQSPYLIRVMFNLSHAHGPNGDVFDPMGGYGQTLFECVLRGVDGASLEISPTASRRSADNLTTLLERLDIPFEHAYDNGGHIFRAETSPPVTYRIINGDTRCADQYFPANTFDHLITDFPYGIRTGTRTQKLQPTPFDQLLDAALPAWKAVLKPSGVVTFAYNERNLPRETVVSLGQKHGFRLQFPHADLSERISDKIQRNIVVLESRSEHSLDLTQ